MPLLQQPQPQPHQPHQPPLSTPRGGSGKPWGHWAAVWTNWLSLPLPPGSSPPRSSRLNAGRTYHSITPKKSSFVHLQEKFPKTPQGATPTGAEREENGGVMGRGWVPSRPQPPAPKPQYSQGAWQGAAGRVGGGTAGHPAGAEGRKKREDGEGELGTSRPSPLQLLYAHAEVSRWVAVTAGPPACVGEGGRVEGFALLRS